MDGLGLPEEGVEVLKLLGGVIVTDGIDLAEIEFEKTISAEVFVEPTEAFPLHEEGLEGSEGGVEEGQVILVVIRLLHSQFLQV